MSFKSTPVLLFFLILVFSCKTDSKKDQTPSKMEEVMRIHDEVMPKMGTISNLIADLKPGVDSTEVGKGNLNAIRELQGAHKSMMDWMRDFGERFDYEEIVKGKELSAEKKEWLIEEEVKVKALRQQINSAITNAETVLGKD